MSGTAYYVCPRCGRPIDYLERRVVRRKGKDGKVREQVYFIAWHYVRGPDGRRQVKKCYLGPEKYVHANRVLATAGLQVKSLAQQLIEDKPLVVSELEELAKAIEEKMAKTEMSAYTAQHLADRLQGLADRLRQYAEEKAKEEAKAKGEDLEAS
jgi:RNA polymerase-binding transcription factor DksA